MNRIPHGYTYTEILIAVGLVLGTIVLIVAISNPIVKFRESRDELRQADVKDLLEVMLEMQYTDSESFSAIVGTIAGGRTMIGQGSICVGDYGTRCSGSDLRDYCVDLTELGALDYIAAVPVDPKDKIYNKNQTGYYMELVGQTLVIGACNPESREEIRLEAVLK